MRRMLTLISTLIVLYAAVAGGMFAFQRHLIYHPENHVEAPEHYGLTGFEDVRATTPDNVLLQLWYHPAAKGFPTIVYYHGNAATLANRAGIFAALTEKGFGLLGLSYRGYAKSQGSPTEQGLYIDARTAIAFLTEGKHIPINNIILFGESLGTGVAVQMATEYDVAGLILQAAYTSVASRAAEIYFYIPVQLLIQDRFDSINKIARVKAPIIMFHGELDTTIPPANSRALMAAATAPKEAFFFPQFSHNDFDSGIISAHVLDFARKYNLTTQ